MPSYSSFSLENPENFGHLDVLVNNARAYIGLLQDMTSEDWDGILSVNLKAL